MGDRRAFYAHSDAEDSRRLPEEAGSRWEDLESHLVDVAVRARRMAEAVVPAETAFPNLAYATGLLHDLGKFTEEFQAMIRRSVAEDGQGRGHVLHAIHGAAAAYHAGGGMAAFAIGGHHSGLQNARRLQEQICNKRNSPRHKECVSRLSLEFPDLADLPLEGTSLEFAVRMLFSVLVDADYLCTERHFRGMERVTVALDAARCILQLEEYRKHRFAGRPGPINVLRDQIHEECVRRGDDPPGFYSLTVPTGGGKTLSSMAFALAHARAHRKRRIIMVLPYLSIIEQNAEIYREVFGPDMVLEHHSGVEQRAESDEDRSGQRRSAHASENWDAPIIVTTNVQFIESLFAREPRRCRKIHNIAQSVVVLDEAQALPSHLLEPTLSVFRDLQARYGVTFLFCTATQPAFRKGAALPSGFAEGEVSEVLGDPAGVYRSLRRVNYKYEFQRQSTSRTPEEIAEELLSRPQALCILNTRAQASLLFDVLSSRAAEGERSSVFHLSSAMCAAHRLSLLGRKTEPGEGTVHYRLQHGLPCRLVSTQVVEAGVDIDFPVVYRAIGPLDSIVQAAGRCNREGRLPEGEVHIFRTWDGGMPRGVYTIGASLFLQYCDEWSEARLAEDPAIFAEYYSPLYERTSTDGRRSSASLQEERRNLNFADVADEATVIDRTRSILVPYESGRQIIEDIRKQGYATFLQERAAQRYMVSVHEYAFRQLHERGGIEPIDEDCRIFAARQYHPEKGIMNRGIMPEEFIQ